MSVSHISTESEIISLNACLRIDGLLALDLWDVVIEVWVPFQREDKKRLPVKALRWQNLIAWIRRWRSRHPWIWWRTNRWVQRKNLRKNWTILVIWGMWKKSVTLAPGNWCGTQAKIQSNILMRGDRNTFKNADSWKHADRVWIFEFDFQQETGAGGEYKEGVSLHEDLSWRRRFSNTGKKVWNLNGALSICSWMNNDQSIDVGLYMSSSMKAVIRLGPNCTENLEVYKNMNFNETQNLFNITQKLEHSEVMKKTWRRSTFSHDQVIKWTKAKVRIYSDSVLCVGEMSFHKEAITRWEGQVEEFQMCAVCEELLGIDGEIIRMEPLPRIQVIADSSRDPRFFYKSRTLSLRNSQIGSSSCQSLTILIEKEKETMKFAFRNQKKSRRTRRNSRRVGRSSILETKRSKVQRCKETGHPVFTTASVLSHGILWTAVRRRNHTLECGCFKHRTLVPNH